VQAACSWTAAPAPTRPTPTARSVAGNAIRAEFGSVTAPAQRLIEFKATVN
jgi:hypothetical protein